LLSIPLDPPVWLLWILVFCILYPFCAAFLGWDWPFERTPSWKDLVGQAEAEAEAEARAEAQAQIEAQIEARVEARAETQAQTQTQARAEIEARPEPEPEPEPEPQTDPQLIEDVISVLQNLGFKKREAKITVLKVCEGRVFEDHQSLIEAALDKSNL
jgi:Holliday junction resolvasome RuvABC DNA-binding subunit